MPTYEYECKECGKTSEFFQGINEAPKRKCPHCGAPRGLRRKIGAGAGLIFRGSGFYITDYRSQSYKEQAKKEKEAASGSSKEGSEKGKKEGAKTTA